MMSMAMLFLFTCMIDDGGNVPLRLRIFLRCHVSLDMVDDISFCLYPVLC